MDGATDFLFMLCVAGLNRLGMPIEMATRVPGVIAHLLTVALVYLAVRFLVRGARWMALVSSALIVMGPGRVYVAAGFGTTFFAFAVCVAWCLAVRLTQDGARARHAWAFAGAGLVAGLIRPEGVVLAALMLAAVVYAIGPRNARAVIWRSLAVFVVVGGVYFAWRWAYFGHPLPNPYYKKGGGHLYPEALASSVVNTCRLIFWLAIPLALAVRSPRSARQAVFTLIPILGFVSVWVLLSDEMNIGGRFQYPVLALAVVAWPALVTGICADLGLPDWSRLGRRARLATACFLAVIGLYLAGSYAKRFTGGYQADDARCQIGQGLSKYADRGYTLAVTEAGLLPLYSGWRAVDLWGLNDVWITHHGRVTEEYLDSRAPALIMFHVDSTSGLSGWGDMTRVLAQYVRSHGFVLATVTGSDPAQAFYYYVCPRIPDCQNIIRDIRSVTGPGLPVASPPVVAASAPG